MDFPIAEKQPDALQRVTQALRDGVHQIDSDDVKQIIQELSSSRNMEIKTLLASYAEMESKLDVTRIALDASQGRVLQLENQQESSLAAYREQCEAVSTLTARNIELEREVAEAQVALDASHGQDNKMDAEWLRQRRQHLELLANNNPAYRLALQIGLHHY